MSKRNGRFVKLRYLIQQASGAPKLVSGYAFETLGWPEFHACVRWDCREEWSNEAWIFDHYESGLALRQAGEPRARKDAPEMMRAFLDCKGRATVLAVLANIKPMKQNV